MRVEGGENEKGASERVGSVLGIRRNKYQGGTFVEQAGRQTGRKGRRKLELDPGIGWNCVW